VTLPTANISAFRARVNEFYRSKNLFDQAKLLLPRADVEVMDFSEVNEALLVQLEQLEPCGNGNPEPVLKANNLLVMNQRRMGADAQHVKLELRDGSGRAMQFLAFNAPAHYFVEPGEYVTIWFQPTVNEWQGRRNVEGRLLHLESVD
jgi:single-stranded-DNA-specific exonuclease